MAPPGQDTRTSWTRQASRTEALLDSHRVHLYREHRTSACTHGPPARLWQGRGGRAVPYPDPKIVTVAAQINNVNPTRAAQTSSARSTAPNRHYTGILRGG